MAIDKIDFTDHASVMEMVKAAQEAEHDQREMAREALHFVTKRDGQWDPYATEKLKGRYRGTFDMVTPVIDQIQGEMDGADFTLRVRPSGGEASNDTADIYDGLIRNIRNVSNAELVFSQAERIMLMSGIDGWEVEQDWVDADAFEQDLIIKKIPNFMDRVWFDTDSEMQDRSDAKWCVVMQVMSMAEYKKRWPDGSGQGFGDADTGSDRSSTAYFQKRESITVGRLLYKKPVTLELVRMSDGKIYSVNEDFEQVKDELAQAGITEELRRTRKSWRVHSRIFDGSDWLNAEQETAFTYLPVVPIYGEFDIVEGKAIYRGKVDRLIDPQRVLNYAVSRDIEEGALSPRGKYWMTKEQAKGHERQLARMNTSADAVQYYNPSTEGAAQPFWQGGAQINPGLQSTIGFANQAITQISGLFAANMGENPGLQSGTAIEQQIGQGNNGTVKWFKSAEVAICHTGRILVDAIPRVYDSTRTIRTLGDDGSVSMEQINTVVFDQQTQQNVELNNLASGQYDVVCEVGPAFKSQQQEATRQFLEMAGIDPAFLERNRDLLLTNMQSPGMRDAAERAREDLLNAGAIPEGQLTDEERQRIAEAQTLAAQQPPQEDPAMVLARAEEGKAQADLANAQNKQAEIQGNQQIKAAELQLEQQKIELELAKFQRQNQDKFNVDVAKISQGQQQIDIKAAELAQSAEAQRFDQLMQMQEAMMNELKTQAETMKTIREATGVDAIVGPGVQANFINQSRIVGEAQQDQGASLPIQQDDLPSPEG